MTPPAKIIVIRLDPPNLPCGGAAWIMDQQLDPEGLDGCIDYDDLRQITAEIISWPTEITPKIFENNNDTQWLASNED